MGEEDIMSKADLRVAYDGEALAGHTMNVRDLGPALMALGEIFVEANKILNGDRAGVEVHVTPKVEENCFDIGLEVLQQWGKVQRVTWHFRRSGSERPCRLVGI